MFCGPTFRFKIFGLTHMMNERLMGNWLFIILWYLKLPKQLSTMHLILQWISNISGILAHAFWDTFHTKLNGFWDKKYYLLHFELKFYHINIFVSINKCNFLINWPFSAHPYPNPASLGRILSSAGNVPLQYRSSQFTTIGT